MSHASTIFGFSCLIPFIFYLSDPSRDTLQVFCHILPIKIVLTATLDLHAAPGSQNADSHSGTSSEANFLTPANKKHSLEVLRILTRAISPFPNVVGIELLNEPQPGGGRHEELKKWYSNAIDDLRGIDPTIPLYISDCWLTDDYAGYISTVSQPGSIIALDHHLYRCFTSSDGYTSISQHIEALRDLSSETPQLFARISAKLESCSSAIVVGEWSGALNPGSFQGLSAEEETSARKDYIQIQLNLFERYCAGWFFWTFKKAQPGDRGWSLRDAHGSGVFPDFIGTRSKTTYDASRKEGTDRRKVTAQDNAFSKSVL